MDDERAREYRRRERARRRDVPPRRSDPSRQRDTTQFPPAQRRAAPRRSSPPPAWEERQQRNTPPPTRRSQPTARRYEEYENEDEYEDEYVYDDERPGVKRPRRRHSFWTAFFTGCVTCIVCIALLAAVIVFLSLRNSQGTGLPGVPSLGGNQTYTQPQSQTINLGTIQQIQVCDKIGNISITVDPQATQASVNAKKIVQAGSQQAAQQLFQHMSVETQPPGTISHALACGSASQAASSNNATNNSLTVNVTIPDSGGLLSNTSNSVDINIVLPPGVLPHIPNMQVGIESSVGNIDVQGVSGLLKIKGNTGNITIKQSNIAMGSTVDTGQGNITFSGNLLVPGTASTQQQQASAPSSFNFSSEKGNISMNLPQNTNVNLDTNANAGNIQSNFGFPIQKNGEMASYSGPLVPGSTNAQATLVVDVSLGNITYQKQNT